MKNFHIFKYLHIFILLTSTCTYSNSINDNAKCTLCHEPPSEWYNTKSSIKHPQFSHNISHVHDKTTNKIITPNAYQIKLPSQLTGGMLEYCNKRGITSLLRDLVTDHPLEVGTNEIRSLPTNEDDKEINWLIQRPDKHWNSNMHWVSPPDEITQNDYLKMLFDNGFDQVLSDLGEYLGLDGLVAYQLTFIGVSYCEKGFMHHDFQNVNNKAFNIIIPLVCSSSGDTTAELLIQDDTSLQDYGYKYIKNIGIAIGDNAIHATAPCDYRATPGEMRMAATVYIADVNDKNAKSIVENYTQEYPPVDEEYLLSLRGLHWKSDHFKESDGEDSDGEDSGDEKKDDGNNYDHPVLQYTLQTNQIKPLQWYVASHDPNDTMNKVVTPYALQIGLPTNLQSTILKYCNDNGITSTFHDLLYGENQLPVGGNEVRSINNKEWYIQRTDDRWNSNMHWISPANQNTQDEYLNMLFDNNSFDQVLHTLGSALNLKGLVAYHLTFIAVSHCEKGYFHSDFQGVNGQAFNIIIPLQTVDGSGEELYVQDDKDYEYIASYKYKQNEGIALGDYAFHATAPCDYRKSGGMRMAATVYVADVDYENVESIMEDYTQYYPPKDEGMLLSIAGMHWRNNNGNVEYVRKQ